MNASDTRNKDAMKTQLAEVCGSTVLSFAGHTASKDKNQKGKKRVIIMDEVDGMSSGKITHLSWEYGNSLLFGTLVYFSFRRSWRWA